MILDSNNQPINRFEPEEEPAFPKQVKVTVPKKRKSKTTPRRMARVKRAIIKYSLILAVIVGVLGYSTYKVNEWFNKNTIKWQSPIQTPVWVEPRSQEGSGHTVKEAAAKEINFDGATFISKSDQGNKDDAKPAISAPNPSIQEIVRKVYQLESSSGRNDACRAKGLFNGYGYRYNSMEKKCFATQGEVTNHVTAWFEAKLQKYTLAEALCGYNLGFSSNNFLSCVQGSDLFPYYRNFLRIK